MDGSVPCSEGNTISGYGLFSQDHLIENLKVNKKFKGKQSGLFKKRRISFKVGLSAW